MEEGFDGDENRRWKPHNGTETWMLCLIHPAHDTYLLFFDKIPLLPKEGKTLPLTHLILPH
jgi:hypothetical protein